MRDMNYEPNQQEKLKAAIEKIMRHNWYLYLLEIDYDNNEIIVCVTDKLLWDLIPTNPEQFEAILEDFAGYTLCEIDENLLRYNGDRNTLLSKN